MYKRNAVSISTLSPRWEERGKSEVRSGWERSLYFFSVRGGEVRGVRGLGGIAICREIRRERNKHYDDDGTPRGWRRGSKRGVTEVKMLQPAGREC